MAGDLKTKAAAAKKAAEKKSTKGGNKNFFRSTINELKKVHWPTKKEVTKYTLVVLGSVIVMATVLFALDSVLSLISKALIG